MYRRFLGRLIAFVALTLIGCSWPQFVHAQMFSAGNDRLTAERSPSINIVVGIMPINFNYRGKDIANGGQAPSVNSDFYQFHGSAIHVGVNLPAVKLYADIGGKATGIRHDLSYFNAGIRLGYGIPLYHTHSFYVHLPAQLHSAFTSVDKKGVVVSNVPSFQLGTFEGTVGAAAMLQAARHLRIGAKVLPSYGFAFSTREQNRNGSIAEIKGQLNLYFDQLFNKAGLRVGYAYTFRQFNIDGELLDYRSLANSFLIGITF